MQLTQTIINTRLGTLFLAASQTHLYQTTWSIPTNPKITKYDKHSILKEATQQINQYLDGERKAFDLPLHLDGTAFQESVWRALLQIPFGETRSYQDIARHINNPKASRAVGTANGKNKICIIIPCHRVIQQAGGVGGYSGGISIKNELLQLEKSSQI